MEEYEPHVVRGNVIYAGVDYEAIVRAAEEDPDGCDIILWDGGNNDFPFYKPDLNITVVDPHRPGDELKYYPGEVTLRMADVAIINKMDTAAPEDMPLKIPSSLASILAVLAASSFLTFIISSIRSTFKTPGINPAPIPCILCGPGLPPDRTGES